MEKYLSPISILLKTMQNVESRILLSHPLTEILTKLAASSKKEKTFVIDLMFFILLFMDGCNLAFGVMHHF